VTQVNGTVFDRTPEETSATVYTPDGDVSTQDHRGSLVVSLGRHPTTGYMSSVNVAGSNYSIVPDALGRPTTVSQSGYGGPSNFSFVYDGPVITTEQVSVPGYLARLDRSVSHTTGRLDALTILDEGAASTTVLGQKVPRARGLGRPSSRRGDFEEATRRIACVSSWAQRLRHRTSAFTSDSARML
jgi:hypothetical protein